MPGYFFESGDRLLLWKNVLSSLPQLIHFGLKPLSKRPSVREKRRILQFLWVKALLHKLLLLVDNKFREQFIFHRSEPLPAGVQ